ncbi:trichohyalin-like [Strongylocentrotus purpuratus]|uniref:Uncharacterized protein n=1 Tax=Strongylocentrotus purpuratus TaxID=7668 RepID=A0A7M7P7D3_STRPU|nr:trichohyalin-like [Strongylocentrotus purpuratus]
MEKEYYSAQKKIKELNGKLETEKQSDSGEKQPDSAVKGNVEEGLLKEKQELLQAIQKLEDRLVGQKDINSRLLSEIEKTREEKRKEAERINEEKEREFKIKTDQLKTKLDLQTAKLRKEHSTTEILKAEFTSIRRELESQIAARDVKIEELRRHIRTEIEVKQEVKEVESDMEGDQGKDDRIENSPEIREELRRKESEIRVLGNALTDENKKFVDLQASLKEREVQLTMLQEDFLSREQLLEDATDSCRRLKRQKGDLDEQVQTQNSEIVILREYLASRDRRIVQMAADLSRRDRRIMTLLTDLREQSSSKSVTTDAMTNTNNVRDMSSLSSSTSALMSTGKTDGGSLSDQSSDDRNDSMDEATSNLGKQLQKLRQYKSDAEHLTRTLQGELEASRRRVAEVQRLQAERDELHEYVTNVEKTTGMEDLSPNTDIIKRLQIVFQTKEKGFTTELAALQEANRDVEGAIIKERKEATACIDNMTLEENERLKLDLESYRTELTNLSEELNRNRQTAQTQIDSLTSLLASYKQHIDSQQQLRKDADQMVGHYISENTQLKARLDQSTLEHENMAKELAAAEKLKSYCMQEKERLEKEFEELKRKLDFIKSDNLTERDQQKTVVEDLSQKLEQKCNELSTTSNNLEQVLVQVGHASEHTQELSRRLGEREDEIHELNVRLLQLDGQRNRMEAEKTVMENQRDAILHKIEDLEAARTESKETLFQNEGRTEELTKETTDLKMRLTCEMNNYEHLKTLHLNLVEKNRSNIEQIHQLQTEMVNLKGQWAIRTNDLKKMKEKMKEIKDQLENEIKSYQSQSDDMTSRIDELEQLREADRNMYEEMKKERDWELESKDDAEERCRKSEEKIEKLQKALKLRRKKIIKLEQERSNRATQEVETSSTVNPVETEERGQQNRSREERVSDETLQQQQQQQQQQQLQQFLLQQELQRNRATHITHDIAELQECLKDSRSKLGQLTETQEALYEENEWLTHELETIHAALEDERTHNQEAAGKMKKVISELKRKRVELHKAKRKFRFRSQAAEETMSTLNQTEKIRNDLSQENAHLVITCREKDAQITLLHEIIKSHQDKTKEPDASVAPEIIFRDCEHDSLIRELERKLEVAEREIHSIKALNCRLNIDMQVKCDSLSNQKAECTRLQAATCDLQQDNWDLKQKLSDVKHKLQTEKQLRKLLEQRYDDELNDIKMKTTLLEDHEKERGVLQSKEIQRKLSKLEHRLQKQEVQPVNISDDQREIRGLKSEIAKLGSLRDLDREALDGLTADLGAIKGLMTSEIQQATNQNSADKLCRPESHSSRVQQALRKAELSAIRTTSFPSTQSETNILLAQSDDLADVATSDS